MRKIASIMASATIAMASVAQTPVYLDTKAPIEDRVEDALSRMTLEEKVALCHAQGKFCSAGVPRLGIPELWMSDGPHGVRAEIDWNTWDYAQWTNDSITVFPALTALAATWNPELSGLYGLNVGEEARYREKDVLLGPGVNIYRTPLNGRNFEYMGEDPYLAGVMAVPYIQNLQKNGVAPCLKHYILNDQETWRGAVDVNLSERALQEIYLEPFRRAVIDGGAWSVMGSYNKIRGQHGCYNDYTINKILKGDWGFDGVVISDWGGTHETDGAALGGLDIEMGSYSNGLTFTDKDFTFDDYYLAQPYLAKLKSGELPMSSVDDKARRILRLIFRTAMNTEKPFGRGPCQDHYDVARAIGDEAIVLLQNNPVGKKRPALLPLDPAKAGTILVIGDNAVRKLNEGGGSSELKAKVMVSPLDGMRQVYGDRVKFAQGYAAGRPIYDFEEVIPKEVEDSLRAEAVAMARDADVVVMFGGLNKNAFQDCENTDRKGYGLPFGQQQLIDEILAVNPNLVLVLLSGNAVELPSAKRIPAIVQGWYLGSMGGESLASVISGQTNPSGKLPFSFPVRIEDCSAHSFGPEAYPGIAETLAETYLDDILVGYRWHDTKKIPALYPFGHGLSYTTFKYGKATVSAKDLSAGGSIDVSIPVTNTGAVAGKETVQVYVGDPKCSVVRPVKELKHFQKVELKPGEEQVLTFTITPDDLKYYDEAIGGWTVEPGLFKIYIGSSSTDISSTVDINYN